MYLVFMVLLFLRHPQAIQHADFWGEDGVVWYADAYNLGWHCLLLPHAGYLQTISRLVALFAQAFPLRWGPTIFASSALLIQALPPALLLSRRMADAWPDRAGRLAFALIYVLLPNSMEVLTNLTNAQWHLACLGFLIITMRPASNPLVVAAELAARAVAGLSGPFAVFLLPVALWQYLSAKTPAALLRLGVVAVCVAIQGLCLLQTMQAARLQTPLGAGVIPLARILAIQLFVGASVGIRILIRLARWGLWNHVAVPVIITLIGGSVMFIALRDGNRLLRQGFLMAALMLAAALATPVASLTEPQWTALTYPGVSTRYFFIPMLVWIGACLSLLHARRGPARFATARLATARLATTRLATTRLATTRLATARFAASRLAAARLAALGFLAVLPVGIVTDFYYPGSPPTDFAKRARVFDQAPAGTHMAFAVHPPGFSPLELTKH